MQKTQTTNFLGIHPNVDTRELIKEIVRISPDPIVKKQTYGWWPRLIKKALEAYLESLKKEAGNA